MDDTRPLLFVAFHLEDFTVSCEKLKLSDGVSSKVQ